MKTKKWDKISVATFIIILIVTPAIIAWSLGKEIESHDAVTGFEYNGHNYLKFRIEGSYTVVHDPDCHCKFKKDETLIDADPYRSADDQNACTDR